MTLIKKRRRVETCFLKGIDFFPKNCKAKIAKWFITLPGDSYLFRSFILGDS